MDSLRFILFSLVLLGEIFFLIRKARFSTWLAPLAAIICDILVLYVFSLLGWLYIGFILVIIASVFLGILAFFPIISNLSKSWFSTPVVAFILLLLFSWVYSRGTLFSAWDEFSHWGPMFRYLMTTDMLPVIDPSIPKSIFHNYPPLINIFHYFTAKFISFEESTAYFAQMTLQFAAIIAIFPISDWKDWKKYLLVFGVLIISAVALDYVFLSIFMDLMLGLIFAAGLSQVSLDGKKPFDRYLLIILICFTLVLTKPTGIYFAMIIVMAEIVVNIVIAVNQKPFKAAIIPAFRSLLSLRIFFLLLVPLLAVLSWSVHSHGFSNNKTHFSFNGSRIDSGEAFPLSIEEYKADLFTQQKQETLNSMLLFLPIERNVSVTEVLRSFSLLAPYRTKLIISNFINQLSENSYSSSGLSVIVILLLILVVVLLNYFTQAKEHTLQNTIINFINLFLFLGFILYCIILILAYIYLFRKYDAIFVYSLYRYLGSYLLGWWLFNIRMIYLGMKNAGKAKREAYGLIFLVGFLVVGLLTIPLDHILYIPPSPHLARLRANKIYQSISQIKFTTKDRIYDIFQEEDTENGFSHNIMRYLITPIPTNIIGWDLGLKTGDTNIFTIPLTPVEWLKLLRSQGYTYVLVSSAGDDFWNKYGGLFDKYDPEVIGQIFKVESDHLEKVDLNQSE